MHYVCSRCDYTTQVYANFQKHTKRKNPCKNRNGVEDNIDLMKESKHKKVKHISKNNETGTYSCFHCAETFKSQASAYRHSRQKHQILYQKNKPPVQASFNDVHHTHINFNQTTNNIFVINVINPFEKETMSHINPKLVLEAVFNSNELRNGYHTFDFFSKIHTLLIEDEKNVNLYFNDFYSDNVLYLNQRFSLENNSLQNAVLYRIQTIYRGSIQIFRNIRNSFPDLFVEIYEKYNNIVKFKFNKCDFDAMLNYLIMTITDLLNNYINKKYVTNQQSIEMVNSIKVDWTSSRYIAIDNFEKIAKISNKTIQQLSN
jgi:hypothetical protein